LGKFISQNIINVFTCESLSKKVYENIIKTLLLAQDVFSMDFHFKKVEYVQVMPNKTTANLIYTSSQSTGTPTEL